MSTTAEFLGFYREAEERQVELKATLDNLATGTTSIITMRVYDAYQANRALMQAIEALLKFQE